MYAVLLGITLIFRGHLGTGYSTLLNYKDQYLQIVFIEGIIYLTCRWTVEGLNQFSTTSVTHDLSVQIGSNSNFEFFIGSRLVGSFSVQ
jgi:hypothetical protein